MQKKKKKAVNKKRNSVNEYLGVGCSPGFDMVESRGGRRWGSWGGRRRSKVGSVCKREIGLLTLLWEALTKKEKRKRRTGEIEKE